MDTITFDRATQIAFARGLIEETIGRIEALMRPSDAQVAHDFAAPLAIHLIAEILLDRYGLDGLAILLDTSNFAARQIAAGDRLTEPKAAAQ